LAATAEISERSIRQYEAGDAVPRQNAIAKLAKTLRCPTGFFFGPDPETLGETAASFRAASRLPKYRQRSALAAGAFAMQLADYLANRFELPAVDIPDLAGVSPTVAAEAVRSSWGLGNNPAPNLIHLLESNGVLCFALAEDCRELDAFSFWRHARPFVLLNTIKSAERGRWDAAHELGHLVLHREIEVTSKEHEMEADNFAQSFLLPPQAIRASGLFQPSLERVLQHKAAWQVSAIAYARALHQHGLASDWHYRSLAIELSKRGYRSGEPGGMSRETSQLLGSALSALRSEGTSLGRIAADLELDETDVYELVFGLAPLLPVPRRA